MREFFESYYCINIVVDVDSVCLAADRKVLQATLKLVMSLQVV